MQSFTTSHKQTNAQPVSEQQPVWKTEAPSFAAERDDIWHRISLWSAGVSCADCVPSQPLVTGVRDGKSLNIAQATAVFITNPKHSTIRATLKKVNSSQTQYILIAGILDKTTLSVRQLQIRYCQKYVHKDSLNGKRCTA